MNKKFRVMVTGGGSGGHIYPIIAVVTELQIEAAKENIDLKVKYLGYAGAYRHTLEENNLKVSTVILSKIRRYKFWSNFLEIPKFILSLVQALWHVYWFMPNVLFSKGGPGSLPVVLAARFYFIPIVIHESDSVPGLSNKLAGKHAKVIATSFPGVQQYFPQKQAQNVVLTGNLIRRSLLQNIKFDREQSKRRLGFSASKPMLFIYGGSQGSQRINNFIIKNLPLILEVAEVYHQTGKENYKDVLNEVVAALANAPESLKDSYKAVPYLETEEEVQSAYIASDLVVSRAGASNIFEIAAFARPSILIPLPEAAQDHQRNNAYEYAETGAAIVIEEDNLLINLFLKNIIDILGNPEKLEKMSEAARAFYKPDAALNLAKILLEFRNVKRRK